MLREDDLLCPLERLRVLIVGGDEGVDLVANLPRRGEAGAGQGFAGEDRKPDLDLVQPGGMGRGKMKMDIGVAGQPAIVFGFVRIQIVQDDVNFSARMFGDGAVHEVQELDPPAPPVMAAPNQAGGDVQGREQGGGAMAFVFVAKPRQRFAIGQLQPALSALQSTAFSGGCR